MDLIKTVQQKYLKKNLPEVRVGDKIVVSFRIKEGNKERIQNFEGIVIALRGQGTAKMVKVRKIATGSIGVERTFPINGPTIAGIKIVKRGNVRRAKLFYLRDRIGKKATKIKEGRMKEGEALLWEAVANTDDTENNTDSTNEVVSNGDDVKEARVGSGEQGAEKDEKESVKSESESAEPVTEEAENTEKEKEAAEKEPAEDNDKKTAEESSEKSEEVSGEESAEPVTDEVKTEEAENTDKEKEVEEKKD